MIYAGFWRRFAGLLIDSLILILPSVLMSLLIPYVGGVLVVFLYYPFFTSSEVMGTPGKAFMGMAVTNEAGGRLTFKQSALRYFFSLISGLFCCFGYIISLFTEKRQTFHDLMVNSVVIRRAELTDVDWIAVWSKEFKRVMKKAQNSFNEADTGSGLSSGGTSGASVPFEGTGSGLSPEAAANMATLENLHKLYQQGILTEAEYSAKKEEILRKI